MIPIEKFGKTHWSLFAYVETRAVDYKGVLDRRHLSIDSFRHPLVAHLPWSRPDEYPTRLKDGELAHDHDEWDCLEDLTAAGLIAREGTGIHPVFSLTDLGRRVASQLRDHKAHGGVYAQFVPNLCDPENACYTHGRCWTHSEWAED